MNIVGILSLENEKFPVLFNIIEKKNKKHRTFHSKLVFEKIYLVII